MAIPSSSATQADAPFSEDMSSYVAELQLHMSLQAKDLTPNLEPATDSLHKLLHDTQLNLEKMASRNLA
ncbi:hypothetical protein Lepto7376_1657 [[Leptolyngbya] sp. PCC 7376]|uniref:hypothetical protein n=1 Tax=[Leptolyngbya] sp. PCC 7376 TaxID=111781 RepID=UPI00029F0E47|nr:hypothetical protein [[Leptolyngbya] sp. PCC 7376]AFY37991.1 hypothetical protein Lepto7376_1657 [[Leptolyngbya] sp. PCC 7376]